LVIELGRAAGSETIGVAGLDIVSVEFPPQINQLLDGGDEPFGGFNAGRWDLFLILGGRGGEDAHAIRSRGQVSGDPFESDQFCLRQVRGGQFVVQRTFFGQGEGKVRVECPV
jgi:hypothetical protein